MQLEVSPHSAQQLAQFPAAALQGGKLAQFKQQYACFLVITNITPRVYGAKK